jgi:hypothetical protein
VRIPLITRFLYLGPPTGADRAGRKVDAARIRTARFVKERISVMNEKDPSGRESDNSKCANKKCLGYAGGGGPGSRSRLYLQDKALCSPTSASGKDSKERMLSEGLRNPSILPESRQRQTYSGEIFGVMGCELILRSTLFANRYYPSRIDKEIQDQRSVFFPLIACQLCDGKVGNMYSSLVDAAEKPMLNLRIGTGCCTTNHLATSAICYITRGCVLGVRRTGAVIGKYNDDGRRIAGFMPLPIFWGDWSLLLSCPWK